MDDGGPVKKMKMEGGDGEAPRARGMRRGGLQRRFRIVEPKIQPTEITEKTGDMGKRVALQSSYTKFSLLKCENFIMYDTVFSELGMSTRSKLNLITLISKENSIPGAFCFDGRRLFTTAEWHSESEVKEYNHENQKLTVRMLTTIKYDTEEYYQMVNVLMNNLQVLLGQERIGKGYFLSSNINGKDVPRNCGPAYFEMNNFKVLGGFSTTLQRGTKSDGTAFMMMYIERINRVLNDNSVVKLYNPRSIDQLIGRDVITKHNNKTYRISDIKEISIEEKFELQGRSINYYEYFKERYNIKLQHRNQPFVLTKVRKPMMRGPRKEKVEGEEPEKVEKKPDEDREITLNIPGELCFLCGFSDQEKSNLDLQKGLAGVLKRDPRQRLDDIPDFCKWLQKNDNVRQVCDKWEFKIDERPLEIEGRELPPCDVMSGGQKVNDKMADDWKFGRVEFAFKRDAEFEIEVIVVDRSANNYQGFMEDINRELRNYRGARIKLGRPMTCGPNDVERCLEDVIRNAQRVPRMALVFVGDDRTYARVKSFTLQSGLLTQCVTTRNGTNRNDKRRKVVASKSLMQIFAKFGYDPWTVEMKLRPTVIVGLDTYHSKGSKKSIHASVFSINSSFTQYLSFVNSPKGRQEFHDTLASNFAAALDEFKRRYDILPQRIMVYRDGVGDSQMEFTKKYEVCAVQVLLEKIYKDRGAGLPQLLYIVVKKRIATKLFNRGNNPNPGTIVDREIVKPNFYEFFLVSQRTMRGTASPTNYNVLEDTRLLTKKGTMDPMAPNELQKITYSLCHLYFNWMGTIRVPVPVHYAHRLAELVGKVHKGSGPAMINDRIRNRLFYL